MTFPTIPTDNFYKFLFIGGIVSLFYGSSFVEEKVDKLHSELSHSKRSLSLFTLEVRQLNDKATKTKKDIDAMRNRSHAMQAPIDKINDSNKADLAFLHDFQARNQLPSKKEIDILSASVNARLARLAKQEGDLQAVRDSLDRIVSSDMASFDSLNLISDKYQIEAESDGESAAFYGEKLRSAEDEVDFYNWLGWTMLFVGEIGWIRIQKKQDLLLRQQVDGINLNCQSCNMKLKLDRYRKTNERYCSHCFQNGAFTEIISLEEFKVNIKKQLLQQGKNWFQIYWFLWRLKKLDRWNNDFRWPEVTASSQKPPELADGLLNV